MNVFSNRTTYVLHTRQESMQSSIVKRSVALLSQQLCRIFSLQHCFTSVPILCSIPAEAHTIRSALTFCVLGIKCKQNHYSFICFNDYNKNPSIKSLVLMAWHTLRQTRKSKQSQTAVDLGAFHKLRLHLGWVGGQKNVQFTT